MPMTAAAALPPLLDSVDAFRAAFAEGLERQLAEPGLGAYILALANAHLDAAIWPLLSARLERRHDGLATMIRDALRSGRQVDAPDDDQLVFLKLLAVGIDSLGSCRKRTAGPWEIQYNPLRALRPTRASRHRATGVEPPPFDAEGFHFNRPFLSPEILWEGELLRRPVRMLYNKFPFVPLHTLLVPNPERAQPQRLDQEMHHYAWHVAERLADRLPGCAVTFNSYGAHASVNHLHFQCYLGDGALPVEAPGWQHNGGALAYPAPCQRFQSALESWFHIEGLHRRGLPYNLLYTGGQLYCLPRLPQGSTPPVPWSAGHAWYEMAGGVITTAAGDFLALGDTDIAAELSRLGTVDV